MKLIAIFLGLMLSFSLCYSQLINPDFEEWEGNDPVGWFTYNIIVEAVEPSDNAQSGNHSARLMIAEMYEASPVMQTIGPAAIEDMVTLDIYYASLTEGAELTVALVAYLNWQVVGGARESTVEVNPQYQLISLEWEPMVDNVDTIQVMIVLETEDQPMIGSVLVDNVVLQGVNLLSVQAEPAESVVDWRLEPAYPNPFNAATTIGFTAPLAGLVELAVYDLAGRRVTTLAKGIYAPGSYRITWNGADDSGSVLPAGVYLVRLTGSKKALYTRVVLIK